MNRHNRISAFKYIFFGFLCFLLLLVFFAILTKHLYKNKPENAEIMVVEGWLPQTAINKAIVEYYSGNYKLMVTTGGSLPVQVEMGYFGTLVFNTDYLKKEHENTEITAIKVNARGTQADDVYPSFRLLLNDSIVGEYFVKRKKKEYEFYINKRLHDVHTVKINFWNDTYTRWRDRNLYVEYIIIGDIKIPARSVHVFYDIDYYEGFDEYRPQYSNYAEYSAFILKYLGFKDSTVTMPVSNSRLNRTYSSALTFRKWFLNSPFRYKSVNIISLGPHSLRTWMTYKKVLGKDTHVGIILVNNERYNQNNWWRSPAGIKDTMHEMASYIYTLLVWPFLNKEP